ncbi:hypothetical protein [Phytoactinopolyspora endophytica]|uniref:hypothetical protein n=1 Tax=Phytoactinopolyspora endophytica TaxID=1642495 RepID=UPI00101D4D00|nr:hypothetical protein [Phytoactinopolyspora endophytica]
MPINTQALCAFDHLTEHGVDVPTREAAPFLALYRTASERTTLLDELEHIRSAGQDLHFDTLTGGQARELEPMLGNTVGAAIRLHRQRYIDPGAFVHHSPPAGPKNTSPTYSSHAKRTIPAPERAGVPSRERATPLGPTRAVRNTDRG